MPILLLGLLLGVGLASAAAQPTRYRPDLRVLSRYQQTITPQELRAHLEFLASDELEGRETATRGQYVAARYLASWFRRLGLEPIGDGGTYYQHFDLVEQRLAEVRLRLEGPAGAQEVRSLPTDPDRLIPRAAGPDSTGGLVLAGYGIVDVQGGRDDYQGLDPRGKWVMVLDGEPHINGRSALTPNGEPSVWARQWWQKAVAARQKGAIGVIVVPEADRFEALKAEFREQAQRIGALSLAYQNRQPRASRFPPLLYLHPEAAAELLRAVGGPDWQAYRRDPRPLGLPESVRLTVRFRVEPRRHTSQNVVGLLEGVDPVLKHEYVVITAHYDHVGIGAPDSTGDRIYNGADDDGSGTVAVLELAEAFARAKAEGHGPKRSILFMAVSAEERGLLGSRYYVDHPLVPLEKTVANLNIDMIGRVDPKYERLGNPYYVYIIGSNILSSDLHAINEQMNALTTKLTLDYTYNRQDDPNRFWARSDHANFGEKGIPFIFYFTGTHADYHRPGDEPHKIHYEKMARIVQLILATTWNLANRPDRPRVDGKWFTQQ
ncbi:MAG: M28 family peptidase [Bacteroidetes bacterium]|nr:M28 family peptidase [Bacteroidota bacterium]MCX7907439.1 M28 family peptidase [Bacteroidota bacterium]MDW8138433.1 M28 family peptidase [Bacteroidota bacterium]